jgi:hypothetical protein
MAHTAENKRTLKLLMDWNFNVLSSNISLVEEHTDASTSNIVLSGVIKTSIDVSQQTFGISSNLQQSFCLISSSDSSSVSVDSLSVSV